MAEGVTTCEHAGFREYLVQTNRELSAILERQGMRPRCRSGTRRLVQVVGQTLARRVPPALPPDLPPPGPASEKPLPPWLSEQDLLILCCLQSQGEISWYLLIHFTLLEATFFEASQFLRKVASVAGSGRSGRQGRRRLGFRQLTGRDLYAGILRSLPSLSWACSTPSVYPVGA